MVVMNRIYCAVGKIIELTQQLEIMVIDICELSEIVKEFGRHDVMTQSDLNQVRDDANYLKEKMSTMTFGALVAVMKESKSLEREELDDLRALLEKRNYFAHEYFKITNFKPNDESMILEEFEALKEFIAKLKQMQKRLEIIKGGLNDRYSYLLKKYSLK